MVCSEVQTPHVEAMEWERHLRDWFQRLCDRLARALRGSMSNDATTPTRTVGVRAWCEAPFERRQTPCDAPRVRSPWRRHHCVRQRQPPLSQHLLSLGMHSSMTRGRLLRVLTRLLSPPRSQPAAAAPPCSSRRRRRIPPHPPAHTRVAPPRRAGQTPTLALGRRRGGGKVRRKGEGRGRERGKREGGGGR